MFISPYKKYLIDKSDLGYKKKGGVSLKVAFYSQDI